MRYTGVWLLLTSTGIGYTWVKAVAAFFLIWGYFSTHQVVFRPWGLQNTKNAFYKKMLCDQASDKIFFIYQTTSHLFFYKILRGRSMPRRQINPVHHSQWLRCIHPIPPCPPGPVTDTHSRVLSRVFSTRPTRSCEQQDQLHGNRH